MYKSLVISPFVVVLKSRAYAARFSFRAGITTNFFGTAPSFNDVLQGADYPLRRQGKINLNAEPFTGKVVQDVQEADTAAILKLVVHEVHRPPGSRFQE